MIRRRSLRTRHIKMMILDEADEMLSQGFKEQIYDVYRYLPPNTQVQSLPRARACVRVCVWRQCGDYFVVTCYCLNQHLCLHNVFL